MQGLNAGLDWVWRDYFWETFNLMVALFIATALISRQYNHQQFEQKIRNTYRISTSLFATGAFAVCLDVEHGLTDRIWIKAILFLTATITIVGADWFAFWLWCMANFHEIETGRTGASGWMIRAPHWLWDTMKDWWKRTPLSRKRLMAIASLFFGLMACLTIQQTITPTAYESASPPQMTAGALNSTYEAWATQTASVPTETATSTGFLHGASTDVAGTLSVTPRATYTPTATFTSSIFEVSPCPTGQICEVHP